MVTRIKHRRGGAERQFSVSHAAATSFPASNAAPMIITGQNAPAKMAVRPSIEKAADTHASTSATMNAARLTAVIERRVTVASGTTPAASVTPGVTDAVTTISSALRRI